MISQQLSSGSKIKHPTYGVGVISKTDEENYEIFFNENTIKLISKTFAGLELIEESKVTENIITIEDIENAIENILDRKSDLSEIIPLAEKWKRGTLYIQPLDKTLQGKEIPIETFFHKIVMLRDRLRVLEQNINSHQKLDDQDKIHLQQYITRIYGSLTTFNILFKEKNHHFIGESNK